MRLKSEFWHWSYTLTLKVKLSKLNIKNHTALNLCDNMQQTGFLAFIRSIFALLQKLHPIFLTLTPFLLLN